MFQSVRSGFLLSAFVVGLHLALSPGVPGAPGAVSAQGLGQAVAAPAGPSPLCAPPVSSALYCMELFPTALAGEGTGTVELGRAPSPFQVAVTPDGRLEYELSAWIEGLPDPSSLGPYTTYVAWATPLELDPVIRLGEVGNGANRLGTVSFNKFLVLVSAETAPDVSDRHGPLILRGRSPSTRFEAHDLLAQAPSAEQTPAAGRTERIEAPAAERTGGVEAPATERTGRIAPPMYPGVSMLAGVMALEPTVAALPVVPEGASPEDFPEARPSQVVELPDGGTLDLEAGLVRRRVGERELVMLAFNGQQPGPLLRVREESTIFVRFVNRTPFPTAVHWHGLRLDNRFDGVPGVTQAPVPPGGSFLYRVYFPDPGLYWYHPHHREDVQQELGLYGNMRVDARDPEYYGSADREEVLILDDLLLADRGFPSFGNEAASHALMGRFGNVFLVDGRPDWSLDVETGEVVRFFFTNASNTRTFNLSFVPVADQGDEDPDAEGEAEAGADADRHPPGNAGSPGGAPETAFADPVPLVLVASDVGRFEREERVESLVLAPAERYVAEARFDEAGRYALMNRVQAIDRRMGVFFPEERVLGEVTVSTGSGAGAADGEAVPTDGDAGSTDGEGVPDDTAADGWDDFDTLRVHEDVVAEMDALRHRFDDPPDRELVLRLETGALPQVTRDVMRYDRVYANPVEWAGTMPVMNWASSAEEVRWILEDPATGLENLEIDWRFAVGDVVKIRIRNERDVFHAMQHPLHFHGQRFLVLGQNGVANENLVWKDTVLLPAGSTTEILLELSNPGRWMAHCHIAEHLEAGMKFVMEVGER